MSPQRLSLSLPNAKATSAVAVRLAPALGAGDAVLLCGPLGAGKTHFARSVIGELLREPEDIPSPTFTLVQTYCGRGAEIWHADLYRLGSADEVAELGLEDAFGSAICLVEWPDRLGGAAPQDALTALFGHADGDDARSLTLEWTDSRWDSRLKEAPAWAAETA